MVALRECNSGFQNIAMCDYQESVTTRQTGKQIDGRTDAGQSDPYVPLCFAGDQKKESNFGRETIRLIVNLVASGKLITAYFHP